MLRAAARAARLFARAPDQSDAALRRVVFSSET